MYLTLDNVIDYLEQCRRDFGGDTTVVLLTDDFEGEGDFIALDQIPLDNEDGSLRTCDECGRVTDAGDFPDWINGVCENCDPSILDHPENRERMEGA